MALRVLNILADLPTFRSHPLPMMLASMHREHFANCRRLTLRTTIFAPFSHIIARREPSACRHTPAKIPLASKNARGHSMRRGMVLYVVCIVGGVLNKNTIDRNYCCAHSEHARRLPLLGNVLFQVNADEQRAFSLVAAVVY